eukprot:823327-Pleurochrysis_carterae.AAC.2
MHCTATVSSLGLMVARSASKRTQLPEKLSNTRHKIRPDSNKNASKTCRRRRFAQRIHTQIPRTPFSERRRRRVAVAVLQLLSMEL